MGRILVTGERSDDRRLAPYDGARARCCHARGRGARRASAAGRLRARAHRARVRVPAALACAAITLAVGAAPAAASSPAAVPAASAGGAEATAPPTPGAPAGGYGVGMRVLRLLDTSRHIRLPDGRLEPRTLLTYVRYPTASGGTDVPDAPAARGGGPFPLVVFAHGFATTPAPYARLLRAWARAGYVVAAPLFPVERAGAPGGPSESDLVNEPGDIRFVISALLAQSRTGGDPLEGTVDGARVAVAGHSDGAEAALAAAYSVRLRDPRVGAAIVLAGAEMSGIGGYTFARGGPALLAAQGTADTSNEPRFTYGFFRHARAPKFLLRLTGAGHAPPYTSEQPQLAVVQRVSIAFLDRYLGGSAAALARLESLGDVPGAARLTADP
jgi:dienelactone hydrolase